MPSTVLTALALVAATVALHAVGLAGLLAYVLPGLGQAPMRFWRSTRLLIGIAWALILIHGIEIAVWALFYVAAGCLPDVESSLYFSGATYATIGYGDLVLPRSWRLLGTVEGLVGILMCGLSTAIFFAFVSRVYGVRHQADADRNGR